jgi:hypothetical protein
MSIEDGVPTLNGLYVAYTNYDYDSITAKRELLVCIDGKWGYPQSDQNYRGHVYGFIGPIPIMRLED